MPIFMKHVVEQSNAIFAINADTKEKADELFENFFNDSDKYEDYRALMNENLRDHITDGFVFENEDAFNKAEHAKAPDFYLGKPIKKKEPVYDLYLILDHECDGKMRKVWEGINMDKLISVIEDYNYSHILYPYNNVHINCYREAAKRNATIIAYRLERRTK